MPQILIFGDSIAYGAWDKNGGWAERLKIFSNKKSIESNLEFYCAVYNLAIDGDTTENLLSRIDFETRQRVRAEKIIFILSIGSNDSEFSNNTKLLRTPPQIFTNNILKLINLAKKFSSNIIFTGLLPTNKTKVDPIPWFPEMSYKNEYIKEYDKIIKNICKKNKIHFIELFEIFEKLDYKKLLEDGVHPNTEGHKIIFETVKNYLIKNDII